MKKLASLLFLLFFITGVIDAQVFVDPDFAVPAQVLAYKITTAPTIDGDASDWADIPWTYAYYNDRDFNNDGLMDPAPGPDNFTGRFKAAWIDGQNKLYLLLDYQDDNIYAPDSVDWYNADGSEIRIDPFNSDDAGEPGSGTAFNIGFRNGVDQHSGIEGPLPEYQAKWKVDANSFPKHSTLELAITLPSGAALTANYDMGFWIYFNENDLNDDSPTSKNAAVTLFPQLWSAVDNDRLGVDASWSNVYYWADLLCVDQHVINVNSGESIQAALDQASEGDIIEVAPGTYSENLIIETPNVRLIGTMTTTDTTIITPADPSVPVITIAADDAAYGVYVENCEIKGSLGSDGDPLGDTKGISVGSATARIQGNYFTQLDIPIAIEGGEVAINAADVVIAGNSFYWVNSTEIGRSNCVFRYNEVDNVRHGYMVSAHQSLAADNSMDIAFNMLTNGHGECGIGYGNEGGIYTIHHNFITRDKALRDAGDTSGDDGIENQEATASTSYVYNNTIVGWKSDGTQYNGPSTFYTRNNIVAYQGSSDYDLRSDPPGDLDYNLSWQNNPNHIEDSGYWTSMTLGSHNVAVDPKFTSEENNDYTVTDASPAVDAGELFPFGFKTYYVGDAPDIGAFETGTPVTDVNDGNNSMTVKNFELSQNYPNPFNPSTLIRFSVPENGLVTLKVYNLLGQEVASLVNKEMQTGIHQVQFNASNLSSGIYFYTIKAGSFTATKKMMLLK